MSQPFHYRQEVYRKLIHLSSLWMPLAIYFLEQKTALVIFAAGMVAVLFYETARRQKNSLAHFLERAFGAALRPEEKGQRFKPSGAIYVLAAACLSTLVFPRIVAVTAMAMMLTGDAAAALLGRKFGRNKIFDKSLEGGLGFFAAALATAVAIAALAPVDEAYIYAAAAAAAVGALVELLSQRLRIDDNLSVPLAAGGVMMLLM